MKSLSPFLALLLLLSGCANTSFIESVSKSDAIFEKISVTIPPDKSTVQVITAVGEQRSGFVPPGTDSERQSIESEFPAIAYSRDSLSALDPGYLAKVGQVIAWGIDLDTRTSGFLKHQGTPLSVTGRFTFDSLSTVNAAVVQGVTTNTVATVATGFQLAPGVSSLASGLGVGLLGGLITGVIASVAVESTISGFLSSKSFGERMSHASGMGAHQQYIPRMAAISEFYYTNATPEEINPKAIRIIFSRAADKNINYSTRVFFASTIGIYRGGPFAEKYPATKGWDFIVTNLNFIDAKIDESDRVSTLRNIGQEIKKNGIAL
jgi:hypothetical protein